MSYGEYSLVDQAEYITHGEFSYCLQPIDQHPDMSPMFLRFGNDIIDPPHPYHTTHLFQNGENEHYHLHLRGIMIDADELHLPRGVFDIKRDGSGGFVIDSGASATVLTTVAYRIFKEAMASYLESHNSNLERFSREEYDLCYKRVRDPEGVNLPHVTFEFANDADFEMEPERVFEISHDDGDGKPLICLYMFEAPASTNGMSVLGVYQQVNHRIVYDVHDGKLHFGLDDCSHAN
ncbi:Aspartic proteinase nepenthesin-2 [Bienertia sinuspersici]